MNTTDDEPLPVLFRAERGGKFKGDVTAVFSTLPADLHGHEMTCYAHIGQHSGCTLDWYSATRPARPDEYADLLTELKSVGYNVRVVRRISRAMREECRS